MVFRMDFTNSLLCRRLWILIILAFYLLSHVLSEYSCIVLQNFAQLGELVPVDTP